MYYDVSPLYINQFSSIKILNWLKIMYKMYQSFIIYVYINISKTNIYINEFGFCEIYTKMPLLLQKPLTNLM